ncbi:chaperone protein dnaJ 11, chloroplastic-like [Magnolia sinica]|uniref:chaperone protein dnaJ 11, chloroplastic-like n=1 Tax=Magnolia sinica TaxID=86752 RepID=UPI002659E3E6|nr:chaperone protein dnaJ 11, chloroplastic-like [Magnolia sinica]
MVTSSSPPFLRSSPQFLGPRISPPSSSVNCVSSRKPRVISAAYTSTLQSSSSDLASTSSLYDVLGLSAGATFQEIKSAYRRLARSCHPDVVKMDRKDTSADEFMKIHAAYSTLSDPDKRADYDRTLVGGWQSRASPFARASPFSSRRTWETDQCW